MTEGVMRFGKHKGKKFEDVPADYMVWVSENFNHWLMDCDLYDYLKANYKRLKTKTVYTDIARCNGKC